ncbi:response regulator [Bifidobacterium pullorum]|uniref:response regulator n=1 Tax=Bifidobacterium pullorum TaxID=78448 RepID=UPI003AF0150E
MRDTSMRTTLRIGVLDNDNLSVEYMKALLGRLNRRDEVSLDIWGSSDVATAIHRCCFDAHRTDVLFLDMALSGMDGVCVCRSIREMKSRCAVVGMTSYHVDTYRKPLREAGAQALLDKRRLAGLLPEVLAAASRGSCYPVDGDFLTVEQSLTSGSDRRQVRPLSESEKRVIAMTLGGMPASRIACELGIAESTVFSYHRNIKDKMGKRTWSDVLDEFRSLHLF